MTLSPDFCCGQTEEPMVYNCTPSELDPRTSVSGIPLCCERGISSGGQEVSCSFLFQSFSLKCSFQKIQVPIWRIAQVCGWRPWKIVPLSWNPWHSFPLHLVDRDWGPTEGTVHLLCLIWLVSLLVWPCQMSNKADLLGLLAWTCHRLSSYPVQVCPVQTRSHCTNRRGPVLKEEDCLPC